MARDRAARSEAKAVRLFVAVDVSDDAKQAVAKAVDPWLLAYPQGRWAPAENWHVTLKFLGSTWPRLLGWLEETVAAVAASHAPATVRVRGLGAFPAPGRARVLWAGIDDHTNTLLAIAADLNAALAKEFRAEARPFHPHLTVARSSPPLRMPEAYITTPLTSSPFPVDRLVLYRSHLQRPAARYEPLAQFPLDG